MTADLRPHEVLATKFEVDLDWSSPERWADESLPCRLCRTLTRSRDAQKRPFHQSCAADLVAEQIGHHGRLRLTDERFPRPAATPALEQTEVTR